jgi:hypothetical protein
MRVPPSVFSPSVTRLPYGAMLNSNKRLRGCSRRRRSRRSFMWYSVRITARCGGGIHSITVSHKTFAEIRSGKVIRLQGDGFATEEGTVADHWEFNTDSLGSVKVYCDNEDNCFTAIAGFPPKECRNESVESKKYPENPPRTRSHRRGVEY